jgi:hypothetical protein
MQPQLNGSHFACSGQAYEACGSNFSRSPEMFYHSDQGYSFEVTPFWINSNFFPMELSIYVIHIAGRPLGNWVDSLRVGWIKV